MYINIDGVAIIAIFFSILSAVVTYFLSKRRLRRIVEKEIMEEKFGITKISLAITGQVLRQIRKLGSGKEHGLIDLTGMINACNGDRRSLDMQVLQWIKDYFAEQYPGEEFDNEKVMADLKLLAILRKKFAEIWPGEKFTNKRVLLVFDLNAPVAKKLGAPH